MCKPSFFYFHLVFIIKLLFHVIVCVYLTLNKLHIYICML